jgi:ATP-dependent exoDNAse (exonuclease V) alpha subunit
MVNREVYEDLLHHLPQRVRILFIGDHGQLEAVEDNPSITKHLGKFELMQYPDFTLTEIQRQAKDSAILKLAYEARRGYDISFGDHGPGVRKISINDALDFDANDPNLVGITYFSHADKENPHHRGRISVSELNKIWRQNLGIEGSSPIIGERLVCRDYIRTMGIPKGTMGIIDDIKRIDNESYYVSMTLEDEREYEGNISSEQFGLNKAIWGRTHLHKWDFGYGLTCHTAQGSEFDSVVIFEPSKGFANWLGRKSYSRWLYTAITRAKRNLLLVG